MPRFLTAALLVLALSTLGRAADFPPGMQTLEIGDAAPDFKLPGIDDRDWTLKDLDGSKLLIVYFTSNHCPVCHAHDPRFMQLVGEIEAAGHGDDVNIVAINPNSGDGLRPDELGYSKFDDSFEDMAPYAKSHGFSFPYLYDGETQRTAKQYGCLATPHVFIFDAQRKLRYKGRLDNSRYPDPKTVKSREAHDAVFALLAGKPVAVPETKPFGCSTKWREKISQVKQDELNWQSADVTLDEIDTQGLAKLVANKTDKYRLFNVWSTTCVPCVEEFPGLIRVSRRMGLRPFELITISTDLPKNRDRVKAYLSAQRAVLPKRLAASLEAEGRTSNNYLLTDPDIDALIAALDPQWEGPEPHTVLVAPGGEVVYRHNGLLEESKLLDVLLKVMKDTY
ncbi:redoxin domain-containing protein [Stieleria sp. TO1_6]|uniref:redoxin domain-containing protein n=1 Tax=Stieleria tagensis TaxID=2956795 RepID=UPI00209B0397|nr:redoxin domain-containing protein [Stieleria tagensis]MCO8124152.1 redoxin domain-containing protein [Stieleria tagensis]